MKLAYRAILLATLALSSSYSFAKDGFTPEQAIAPIQKQIEGRTIDIVGLLTGMTVNEAVAALSQTYPADKVQQHEGTYNVGSKGVTVQTTPFVQQVAIGDVLDPNGVEIYFTGPAAGNQVVAIERSVSFEKDPDKPLMATIVEALIQKYGEPSSHTDRGSSHNLVWVYKNGAQIECQYGYSGDVEYCPVVLGTYSFDLAKDDDDHAHLDLVITASVRSSDQDQTLAGWMQVSMQDPNLEHRAGQADFNSLVAEWERAQAAAPVIAAPKL